MNYTEEEEKIFLEGVDSRFSAEKETFFNELSSGKKDFGELLEYVEECDLRLQDDMKEVEVNDNTRAFFNRLMLEINSFYSNIYFNDPKLLTQKITNRCNSISSSFSTCEGKLTNGLNIYGDLTLFKNRIDKLDIFVRNFDNATMRNNPIVARVLDKTKDFLKDVSKDYEELVKKAGTLANRKEPKKEPKISDEVKKDVLFMRINRDIENLMDARSKNLGALSSDKLEELDSLIAKLEEQKDLFIRAGKENRISIFEAVGNVERDLKKNFNYHVDKNEIKKNLAGRAGDAIKEKASNVKNSVGVQKVTNALQDYNKYASLLKVMYDYSDDLSSKASLYIDQNSHGSDSKLEQYAQLDNQLKNLIDNVERKNISYSDANAYFKNIVNGFKNNVGYVYKEEKAKNPKRRQIVGSKKLGLGIGGAALGAIGVGAFVSNAIFYAHFGIAYAGITPFVIPAAITITAGIMLKKAFTSKETKTVLRFIQKLSSKAVKNRGIDPNMEGQYVDEVEYASLPSYTYNDSVDGYDLDGYTNDDSYTGGRRR